jgi:hypothetical protein
MSAHNNMRAVDWLIAAATVLAIVGATWLVGWVTG